MSAFIFGGEPPEELRSLMQQEYERASLVQHLFIQDVKDMIEALSPEQQAVLKSVFNGIAQSPDDAVAIARYYEGLLAASLIFAHGRCSGCGHDHADEFLEKAVIEEDKDDES